MEVLKQICSQWLRDNFGMNGQVTSVDILGQNGPLDEELGLGQVKFEFTTPDGTIGDSVITMDMGMIERAIVGVLSGNKTSMVKT